MRACPFLMRSSFFSQSIRELRYYKELEESNLEEFIKLKYKLLKSFECPALTIGLECVYNADKEEKGIKKNICKFGAIHFNLNLPGLTPGMILPPGMKL